MDPQDAEAEAVAHTASLTIWEYSYAPAPDGNRGIPRYRNSRSYGLAETSTSGESPDLHRGLVRNRASL